MSLPDAWQSVHNHAARLGPFHLRTLFSADPDRARSLVFEMDDLSIDVSKEKIDTLALTSLLGLAKAADVEARRDAMAAGAPINLTEGRSVLHMALRGSVLAPPGDDVSGTLNRFLAYAEAVRSGNEAGSGGSFTDIVNIGIGGSDLGPVMAAHALASTLDGPRLHFVSNVDGAQISDCLATLDPTRTLIVVASKSFSTHETMANARLAKAWLGQHANGQMAAVSTNLGACSDFGIPEERVFGFWNWVGGRYSLWSSIGLILSIGLGSLKFREMLDGASAMDRHFLEEPLETNLPILLALIGIWRRNALGYPTVALIPYDQRLARFPAYIQQLDMESNGKRVRLNGEPISLATAPVVWGEPGTNAQHSFFQMLHQGTDIIPVDFIAAAEPTDADRSHHDILLANCLAQSQALAFGRTAEEVRDDMGRSGEIVDQIARLFPHRVFPGDRPSTTILFRKLDPFALGRLIALFEHKVFVQGAIWGVNSFDQWGVELGKVLARNILPALSGDEASEIHSTTSEMIARIKSLRG